MSPLEIIKEELKKSALSLDDQEEFLWFIGRMPGRYLIDIIDMSREDPNFFNFLWSNYSKKQKAFISNDGELTQDVLKEEKAKIEEMNHQ